LLQNRIAYACCHSGTCSGWYSDSYSYTDSYSYSHTYYDSTAYSHSADHTHTKNSSHPAASPKPVIGLHVASAGIPADEFGLSAGSRSCDAPASRPYRMPESHSHWTFVIWPATTSTSNGPYRPILLVVPLRETL